MYSEIIQLPTNIYINHNASYTKQDFVLNGRPCTIIIPSVSCNDHPWVWRMEFLGAFDYADQLLLRLGWHIAYCNVKDMFGHSKAIQLLKTFHTYVTSNFQLNPKASLFGFSRGGLYAFNYALTYPDDVDSVYFDAPVLNIHSWPEGTGKSQGSQKDLNLFTKLCQNAEPYINPIDCLDNYAKLHLKTLIVAGLSDSVVPWEENGALLVDSLKLNHAPFHLILKPGCEHHPHSIPNADEIVFFLASIQDLEPSSFLGRSR